MSSSMGVLLLDAKTINLDNVKSNNEKLFREGLKQSHKDRSYSITDEAQSSQECQDDSNSEVDSEILTTNVFVDSLCDILKELFTKLGEAQKHNPRDLMETHLSTLANLLIDPHLVENNLKTREAEELIPAEPTEFAKTIREQILKQVMLSYCQNIVNELMLYGYSPINDGVFLKRYLELWTRFRLSEWTACQWCFHLCLYSGEQGTYERPPCCWWNCFEETWHSEVVIKGGQAMRKKFLSEADFIADVSKELAWEKRLIQMKLRASSDDLDHLLLCNHSGRYELMLAQLAQHDSHAHPLRKR